jgi:hypothetical protein
MNIIISRRVDETLPDVAMAFSQCETMLHSDGGHTPARETGGVDAGA